MWSHLTRHEPRRSRTTMTSLVVLCLAFAAIDFVLAATPTVGTSKLMTFSAELHQSPWTMPTLPVPPLSTMNTLSSRERAPATIDAPSSLFDALCALDPNDCRCHSIDCALARPQVVLSPAAFVLLHQRAELQPGRRESPARHLHHRRRSPASAHPTPSVSRRASCATSCSLPSTQPPSSTWCRPCTTPASRCTAVPRVRAASTTRCSRRASPSMAARHPTVALSLPYLTLPYLRRPLALPPPLPSSSPHLLIISSSLHWSLLEVPSYSCSLRGLTVTGEATHCRGPYHTRMSAGYRISMGLVAAHTLPHLTSQL